MPNPPAVTWRSCIASSSAACVFGGVRLISSARITFAKTGPFTYRSARSPVERSSSITSVPVMSLGIRSGVNWIRLNFRLSVSASVEISNVFASPGTPTTSACPRQNSVIRSCSTTSSCPTTALCTSSTRRWYAPCTCSIERFASSRELSPRVGSVGPGWFSPFVSLIAGSFRPAAARTWGGDRAPDPTPERPGFYDYGTPE